MDANKLVKVHIKIRDALKVLSDNYKTEESKLKEQQGRIEGALLGFLQESKLDSVRTDSGTFYRQEEIIPRGDDWEAFYAWVKEHDAFDALERRIKKTFVKDYMEGHEGAIPPGVSVFREYVVRIRRA